MLGIDPTKTALPRALTSGISDGSGSIEWDRFCVSTALDQTLTAQGFDAQVVYQALTLEWPAQWILSQKKLQPQIGDQLLKELVADYRKGLRNPSSLHYALALWLNELGADPGRVLAPLVQAHQELSAAIPIAEVGGSDADCDAFVELLQDDVCSGHKLPLTQGPDSARAFIEQHGVRLAAIVAANMTGPQSTTVSTTAAPELLLLQNLYALTFYLYKASGRCFAHLKNPDVVANQNEHWANVIAGRIEQGLFTYTLETMLAGTQFSAKVLTAELKVLLEQRLDPLRVPPHERFECVRYTFRHSSHYKKILGGILHYSHLEMGSAPIVDQLEPLADAILQNAFLPKKEPYPLGALPESPVVLMLPEALKLPDGPKHLWASFNPWFQVTHIVIQSPQGQPELLYQSPVNRGQLLLRFPNVCLLAVDHNGRAFPYGSERWSPPVRIASSDSFYYRLTNNSGELHTAILQQLRIISGQYPEIFALAAQLGAPVIRCEQNGVLLGVLAEHATKVPTHKLATASEAELLAGMESVAGQQWQAWRLTRFDQAERRSLTPTSADDRALTTLLERNYSLIELAAIMHNEGFLISLSAASGNCRLLRLNGKLIESMSTGALESWQRPLSREGLPRLLQQLGLSGDKVLALADSSPKIAQAQLTPFVTTEFLEWLESIPEEMLRARLQAMIKDLCSGNSFQRKKTSQSKVLEAKCPLKGGYRLYYQRLGDRALLFLYGGTKGGENHHVQSADIARAGNLLKLYRRTHSGIFMPPTAGGSRPS